MEIPPPANREEITSGGGRVGDEGGLLEDPLFGGDERPTVYDEEPTGPFAAQYEVSECTPPSLSVNVPRTIKLAEEPATIADIE